MKPKISFKNKFANFDVAPMCVFFSVLIALGCLQGCGRPQNQAPVNQSQNQQQKTLIMTVNGPLQYMAERLVDPSWAEVVFPADASVVDPAFWNPSPAIIRQYQEADLILLHGGDYAQWVKTSSLMTSRLHDTSETFRDRFILMEDAIVHQHGPEGEHSHEGYATTTWLDFELAIMHANSIYEALKKRWPENSDTLEKNHSLLVEDLQKLHGAMKTVCNRMGNIPLLASHPVYQYAERAYQLNLHSLHWEPDATPEEKEWLALDAYLKETPTEWMIWEDTPNEETQNKLEERGIQWIVFRPQGGTVSNGNFLSVMKRNIGSLASIKP